MNVWDHSRVIQTEIWRNRTTDLSDGQTVLTLLENNSFNISLTGATPAINAKMNNANIIATNVQAVNGVVHVIGTVILLQL